MTTSNIDELSPREQIATFCANHLGNKFIRENQSAYWNLVGDLEAFFDQEMQKRVAEERVNARSGLLGRLYAAGMIDDAAFVVGYRTLLRKDLRPVDVATIDTLQAALAKKEDIKST